MKKILLPASIFIGGLVLTALLIISKPDPKPTDIPLQIPNVETVPAIIQSTKVQISSQGSVIPKTEIQLSSEVSGRIEWVSTKLDNGSKFKKGDILLRIDKRDYELNLTNAESNLYQAKVNLEREIAESQIAKDQWSRTREGTPSDLALRKPQLAQAQALLKAAEANFEIAQRNLSRTSLKAPFDGRIKNKFVDVGAVISPGVPLALIYSTDKIEIYLPIAEQDLEFLDINLDGNPIPNEKRPNLVLYNDYGGKKFYWEGKIVRSTAEIDPQTRMISLIGEINNPFEGSYSDNPLKIGMFLNAIIDGKKFNDVVRVPRYAVRDDKIWVVNQEGILTSKKVTVLRYEQGQALIISGLDNGDEILLTKLSAPVDGMRLNVY